ncbi:MAG: sensor histidine kinase KdpD [Bdellovibrionales bacterium]
MTDENNRPSPEALLKEAQSEHVGKLKIFLGAAPGVGKTYAMLGAAKNRLNDGIDTIIGIVETHQRSETQALADGIETIPRQKIDYRGLTFEEMDLDAILKRKPKLVLVDELAHTNIPGVRHPKRYQDVQEILEAGIDVYSTLNVQHIESLNNVVARITGVKVRETVPDSVIQMAKSIELIDLPPDELLHRLKEGKVYIPEQARLAVNRYFTPGNLTALRELALRQAAERVDEQMTDLMRRHSITGPWPTSNRVMVCISDDNQATLLVRAAKRSAERRQASWIVLYVETSRHAKLSDKARSSITQALALGESLGAETVTVTSEDVPTEIVRIAREHNVNTIILGKSRRSLWSRLIRPSVATSVVRNGEGFDLLLINDTETSGKAPTEQKYSDISETPPWRFSFPLFCKTVFAVGLSWIAALLASSFVEPVLLPFFFIPAVLLVALDADLITSFFATLLSCFALILLLVLPDFSFSPTKEHNVVSIFFFFTVCILMCLLANRTRITINTTRRHAEHTQSLYDFTKSIAAAATLDDVAQATVRRIAIALGAQVAILLPHNEKLEIVASVPADLSLDTASNAAMDWAWRHRKPAGFQSDTLPGVPFYGLPLQAGANTVGVIAIKTNNGRTLTSSQGHYLLSLSYQVASAIERAKLVTDVAQARLQTEMEKLRTSLLSSVSHDMRVPLDSIILTSRNLSNDWNDIPPQERLVMVSQIEQESDRLDRFIENFLDMTELVTGNMHYNRKPTNLHDVIELAMARLDRRLKERQVTFDCPEDLPLIEADSTTLRRVFVNVIENACSYSLPDQPIKIIARQEGDFIKTVVSDRGVGIPESERQRVFDMFYRVKKDVASVGFIAGAGLGLSICRGFIEAHHGQITAQSGENGEGTSIIITIPIKAEMV